MNQIVEEAVGRADCPLAERARLENDHSYLGICKKEKKTFCKKDLLIKRVLHVARCRDERISRILLLISCTWFRLTLNKNKKMLKVHKYNKMLKYKLF